MAETRFCSRLFLHMMKGAIFLKPKQQLFITLLVIIGTLFNQLPVTASAFNFSVTPITSENQIDKRKTYFDLQLVPDQEVELKAELRNDTEKEVKIDISVNSATTNSNVMVEYGKNEIEKDESLIFDLIDYVSYPETVTLEPKKRSNRGFSCQDAKRSIRWCIGWWNHIQRNCDGKGSNRKQGSKLID